MTSHLFKRLYLDSKLTDEEYQDIPQPRFELHYHVAYKFAQVIHQ